MDSSELGSGRGSGCFASDGEEFGLVSDGPELLDGVSVSCCVDDDMLRLLLMV